jgi:hypothetical protein
MTDPDLDDTARLLLMGGALEAGVGGSLFGSFAKAMRAEHPGVDLVDLKIVYEKYCGWDGRAVPTHDVATGRPLRR